MKDILNKIFSLGGLGFLFVLFAIAVVYLLIPQNNFWIALIVLLTVVVGGAYLYDKDIFKGFKK